MRHSVRRRGGHGPAFLLFLLLLLALLLTALTAHAAADPDWRVYSTDAIVDTLDGSRDELFSAGAWVLVHKDWKLERNDPGRGTAVTAWRPVKHPLVRFATGPANVRVAFALRELDPRRTEIRVLGGIASRTELGGAVLPLAQAAGRKECEGFVVELKARALEQLKADGAGSGIRGGVGEMR